jgi:hypothetical protein
VTNTPPVRRRYSPAVYRRRRLAVFLVFVVVVILVIVIFSRCGSATAPTPTPTRTPTSTPNPIPLVSPTPAGTSTPGVADASAQYTGTAPECLAKNLTVGAITDKTEYAAGELPQLSMTVTNKGTVECKVNVGTSQQVFQVTSGDDLWWQSTDCQTEETDFWMLLPARKTEKTGTPVSWVRERSSPDTCDTAREAAVGEGASYYLTTSLGGAQSQESKQFLLY